MVKAFIDDDDDEPYVDSIHKLADAVDKSLIVTEIVDFDPSTHVLCEISQKREA